MLRLILLITSVASCTLALLQHQLPRCTRWLSRTTQLNAVLPDANVDRERKISDLQVTEFKGEDINKIESVFRKYPFHDAELPELTDVNNYYCGTYGDMLWHQNGDQVFVFIPIYDDSLTTKDVSAKISVTKVEIKIRDQLQYSFSLIDKVIPDGSFWVWEKDRKSGQRYIQLDLEKRFRMINWKSLFVLSEEELQIQKEKAKSDLFQQFMNANKGMAKLTGNTAPSEEELIKDLDFMDSIDGVPEKELLSYQGTDEDGKNIEIDLGDIDDPVIPFETFQEIVDAKRAIEGEDSIPAPKPFVDGEDIM